VTLALERMQLHDTRLTLRMPIDGESAPERILVDTVPGFEGLHQRIEFSEIQARIRSARVLRPDQEGEQFDVERLSLVGRIFEDPFVIQDFRGVVERFGEGLALDFERLWLPGSELGGTALFLWGDAETGMELELDAEATVLELEDFRWLEPRLPAGRGRLALSVRGPLTESSWRIREADLEVEGSRIRGMVGFDLGPTFRFAGTDLEALPFELALLDPWLPEPLPFAGRVRGRLQADGPLSNLQLNGRVTYDDPAAEVPASTVALSGGLGLTPELRARDLHVEVDPLRFRTLQAFLPELEVEGEGRLRVEASGTLSDGVELTAELDHAPDAAGRASRVLAVGSVRQVEGGWLLDLDGTLDPLNLDGVAAAIQRELPLGGPVSGPVRLSGPLEDLQVGAELVTRAGGIELRGRFDVLRPGARYVAEGRVEDFALHQFLAAAPDPTLLTGSFHVDGRGTTLEELAGRGGVDLVGLDVFGVQVDRVNALVEAREGRLVVEELEVVSPVGHLDGRGDLGLRRESLEGEFHANWEVESLALLRPVLLGDTLIAGDTLTDLERMSLRMQGIDPDTLPDAIAVALEGRAYGDLTLRGIVQDLHGEASVRLEEAVYGDFRLDEGRVDLTGRWAGEDDWSVQGTLSGDRFEAGGFALARIEGEAAYRPHEGTAFLHVIRDEDEAYQLGGAFAVDTVGVELELETLTLDLAQVTWALDAPSRLRVEGRTVHTDELRLSRPRVEEDPASPGDRRMVARGTLSFDGESDFELEAGGVDIHRIGSMLQFVDPPQGFLDLALAVEGPFDGPRMDGRFVLREFQMDGTALSRVEGTLGYEERMARAELMADLDGRRILTAEGRIPVDLSLTAVEDRFPDRNLDASIQVDEFPLAWAVAFLEGLEDVEGTIQGRVDIRGTPEAVRPSGRVVLQNGATAIPELGLRLTGIGGTVVLREDRIVEVNAEVRARGDARVEGTISLEDVTDPGFDLRIAASGFQAVDRRDLNARVGGEVTLTGSFTRPRVGGRVRVEQGTLFVEEFARAAEVVDLTDPAFFDVVDTTLVAARPALEAAQNPFIQNLRVDVDLVLQRDFWLRSREMNMEMAGELAVTFDRPRREILLVGSLDVVRGVYSAFGRQFQVREGTVEFVGTPGIDPALDVDAVNRLRREGGEPLEIIANVGGTLTNLEVSLSSDAQPPIAQSDLISYLIFGRPSGALASGETSVLEGVAGAGVSAGFGAVATQLGAVVARQFGVDYLTITQSREGGAVRSAGLGGVADTQIELGQYVGENLFLALMVRPLTGLGARTQTQFPGARLEWRFSDLWSMEAFVEDRFAREAASGFGQMGLRLDKVFGLSVYREWSY
jgi:hypothetical protein